MQTRWNIDKVACRHARTPSRWNVDTHARPSPHLSCQGVHWGLSHCHDTAAPNGSVSVGPGQEREIQTWSFDHAVRSGHSDLNRPSKVRLPRLYSKSGLFEQIMISGFCRKSSLFEQIVTLSFYREPGQGEEIVNFGRSRI